MQYTAALIEYVITGLISLIWIALLLSMNIDFLTIDYNKFKEVLLIIIFPLAYIAGIFIDTISSFLFKKIDTISSFLFKTIKNILGNQKEKNTPDDENDSPEPYEKSSEILSYSISDTIRTMESYVSRDRIARGMALNSLMIGVSMIFVLDINERYPLIIAFFTLTVISIVIRGRLKGLSDSFKLKAIYNLRLRNSKKN
ncbi:hypothetical protein AB7198_11610 [Providencia rettgeri]|uniref:hypothetical protein n=1 Tax=unclassified Providencia TaxID=2633465 RepID=UPI00234AE93B|nr:MULTISPECIES: hypothetical protein [unclassified Providencia]